jgi:hypothetical protein
LLLAASQNPFGGQSCSSLLPGLLLLGSTSRLPRSNCLSAAAEQKEDRMERDPIIAEKENFIVLVVEWLNNLLVFEYRSDL